MKGKNALFIAIFKDLSHQLMIETNYMDIALNDTLTCANVKLDCVSVGIRPTASFALQLFENF